MAAVKRILSEGQQDINGKGGKWMSTPVMGAAFEGHREVVEFLVGKGADLSLVDGNGNNILHWACGGGYVETVEFVLSQTVVDINSRGERRRLPVMAAAGFGRREVVEFLVGKGTDVSLVDEDGDNILHYACRRGDLEMVKFVLSLNVVDIDARNKAGQTPTDVAKPGEHQRLADLMVSRGAQ